MKAPTPFEILKEIYWNKNRENKEIQRFIFEKSDNISLWIIGIAIGGLSIFANNIGGVKQLILPDKFHPILIFLVISVSSGIFYRSLYLVFYKIQFNVQQSIDHAFMNYKSMDTKSVLTSNETFVELIEKIENNCGDFSFLNSTYNGLDENKKKELYDSLIKHYLATVEFAKNNLEYSIDYIADTYSKYTGISKNKFKEIGCCNIGKLYFWVYRLLICLYISYITTFIIALLILISVV